MVDMSFVEHSRRFGRRSPEVSKQQLLRTLTSVDKVGPNVYHFVQPRSQTRGSTLGDVSTGADWNDDVIESGSVG